jgi:hypothetical protein
VTEAPGRVPTGHLDSTTRRHNPSPVLVYAVVDDALSADFPLGDSLEVFVRRNDAERFMEEDGDILRVGFDEGEILTVWNPAGVTAT